jgi:hypothetical protein
VRVREQTTRFKLGKLVAHRRGRDAKARLLNEVSGPDGLTGRDVGLDHAREDLALSFRKLGRLIRCHLQAF